MNTPLRIVFVTPVYESSAVGPATFAQYMHSCFGCSSLMEFELVTGDISTPLKGAHIVKRPSTSYLYYRHLLKAARSLLSDARGRGVLHLNVANLPYRDWFMDHPSIIQVNDYESLDASDNLPSVRSLRNRQELALLARRHWLRQWLEASRIIVANSEYVRAELERSTPNLSGRVRVIHKGVDLRLFDRRCRERNDIFPEQADGPRLLLVGSHWRRKGLDILLKALPEIRDAFPQVSLSVVGLASHNMLLEAHSLVRTLGLRDIVHFRGRLCRGRIAHAYWSSDFLVMPSRTEALGVAAIEAMAAGLPVVASTVGGLPEVVCNNVNGVLVPPESPESLATALVGLIGDPQRARNLAEGAQATARRFDIKKTLAQYALLYKQLG